MSTGHDLAPCLRLIVHIDFVVRIKEAIRLPIGIRVVVAVHDVVSGRNGRVHRCLRRISRLRVEVPWIGTGRTLFVQVTSTERVIPLATSACDSTAGYA